MSDKMDTRIVKPLKWVYDRLICEFEHWDICLVGLIVDHDGRFAICRTQGTDDSDEPAVYMVNYVELDDECRDFLADYKVAYRHLFYEHGVLPSYDGRPLDWFTEKWHGRNPIVDKVKNPVFTKE